MTIDQLLERLDSSGDPGPLTPADVETLKLGLRMLRGRYALRRESGDWDESDVDLSLHETLEGAIAAAGDIVEKPSGTDYHVVDHLDGEIVWSSRDVRAEYEAACKPMPIYPNLVSLWPDLKVCMYEKVEDTPWPVVSAVVNRPHGLALLWTLLESGCNLADTEIVERLAGLAAARHPGA